MPKEIEQKLEREADKKGLKGKRKGTYVWGTMRKLGWIPKKKK